MLAKKGDTKSLETRSRVLLQILERGGDQSGERVIPGKNYAATPIPNRVHGLVTLDRSPRAFRRTESKARRDPLLDESMVLLDDMIQVGRCSATTTSADFAGLLQLGDRAWVRRVTIDVDHPRRGCDAR